MPFTPPPPSHYGTSSISQMILLFSSGKCCFVLQGPFFDYWFRKSRLARYMLYTLLHITMTHIAN